MTGVSWLWHNKAPFTLCHEYPCGLRQAAIGSRVICVTRLGKVLQGWLGSRTCNQADGTLSALQPPSMEVLKARAARMMSTASVFGSTVAVSGCAGRGRRCRVDGQSCLDNHLAWVMLGLHCIGQFNTSNTRPSFPRVSQLEVPPHYFRGCAACHVQGLITCIVGNFWACPAGASPHPRIPRTHPWRDGGDRGKVETAVRAQVQFCQGCQATLSDDAASPPPRLELCWVGLRDLSRHFSVFASGRSRQ